MKRPGIVVKEKFGQWFVGLCLLFLFSDSVVQAQSNYRFVRAFGGPGLGELLNPHGTSMDKNGNIYVADTDNNRIQKFDSQGHFLLAFGSYGSGNGQLNRPYDVAADGNGNVYVADTDNSRIEKFDSQGNFLLAFGSYGSDNSQFSGPKGIAVDSSGSVYVGDTYNNRIQKFDSSGTFLLTFGSYGSGNGQFSGPESMAADTNGNVYVVDTSNNRLQKFDSSGNFLFSLGSSGTDTGQFSWPSDVAVDGSGNIYVADTGNVRIQKFNKNGTFVLQYGIPGDATVQPRFPLDLYHITLDSTGNFYVTDATLNRIQKFNSSGNALFSFGNYGTANGQFNGPADIAIDSNSNIYVADAGNNRIQKFDSQNNFLLAFGSYGYAAKQFLSPVGISIDKYDNIYVSDTFNDRIQKFDSNGTFLFQFGTIGYYPPGHVAVDSSGNLYVVITGSHIIRKFDSRGALLSTLGGMGSANGQFYYPQGIAVDGNDNIYVADASNYRIQKFDSRGNFLLSTFGQEYASERFFPLSIAVDRNASIYAIASNSVQKFDSDGHFLCSFGSMGVGEGQFITATGIAVDNSGNVYVADSYTSRIQVFAPTSNTQMQVESDKFEQFVGARGETITLKGNLKRTSDNTGLLNQTLTFKVDGTTVGTATTNASGSAWLSTYKIPADTTLGFHTVTVEFAGNGPYLPSSGSGVLVVGAPSTKITVVSDTGTQFSGVAGQGITLKGNLKNAIDNTGLPGKTLTFKVDGIVVGTGTPTIASGSAWLNGYKIPASMTAGVHTITVEFAGDENYYSSIGTGTLTIPSGTKITVVSDTNTQFSGVAGQMITLKGNLKRASDNTGLPGKTLTFKVDGKVVGTATTYASGSAWLNGYKIPADMPTGVHTITVEYVEYSGDGPYGGYNSSSGTGTLTITAGSTKVTVLSDAGTQFSGTPGQMITLKGNLKRASDNTGLLGQTLTFKVDGTVMGTATTYASGNAWLNGFKIPANITRGVHTLTVEFAGNSNYNASSGMGTLTIN